MPRERLYDELLAKLKQTSPRATPTDVAREFVLPTAHRIDALEARVDKLEKQRWSASEE